MPGAEHFQLPIELTLHRDVTEDVQNNSDGTRTAKQKFVLGVGQAQGWQDTQFRTEVKVSSNIDEVQTELDEFAEQEPISVVADYFDTRTYRGQTWFNKDFDLAEESFTESVRKTMRGYALAGYVGGVATGIGLSGAVWGAVEQDGAVGVVGLCFTIVGAGILRAARKVANIEDMNRRHDPHVGIDSLRAKARKEGVLSFIHGNAKSVVEEKPASK